MAKVKLNPVLETFSGKVGDLVFKHYGGGTILARAPAPPAQWSSGQAAHREQFRLATLYGKAALADPRTKALYDAKSQATGTPVFALMVADFFHAPVVDEIDLSGYHGQAGETIQVRASDDFEVTGVAVAIRDTAGAVLEQGAAVSANDSVWNYTTTATLADGQHVAIEVSATDRPGHKGTKTEAR